jgi:Na+/melibiose symporter-like transporter
MFFLARTVGEIFSSYFKGLFVDIMPLRHIFFITIFVPILLILSGFILYEEPKDSANSEANLLVNPDDENAQLLAPHERRNSTTFGEFMDFFMQRYILIPILFIIIFKATPNYHDSFFYFITNDLKLTATDLGKISFCSTIGILFAIMVYKTYLKSCNFKVMIILGTMISFLMTVLALILVLRINIHYGISDFWLLLLTSSFLSLVGELVLLPILSLAAVLCPRNLEGTVYSVFMSTLNFGGIISNMNGAVLTKALNITSKDSSNLHWLIIISKVTSLMPLPMLCCIDDKYFHPETKEEVKAEQEEKK